ncbi:P60 katanin [Giardia lamblia P15]|uniref:p60 katanin n=1 Tax=Giardia intestinalis (strain P15) TaxID=658858 RepID=E1F375_GIAIA|nr:P60 katanin [Giardia lamblia P15]
MQQREETSLARIKAAANAREAHINKMQDRKRDAVVLVLDFLRAEGYVTALANLEGETGISLSKYQVCDNIDLLHVVQEYQEYFSYKYDKEARIVKKAIGEQAGSQKAPLRQKQAAPPAIPKQLSSVPSDDQKVSKQSDPRTNQGNIPRQLQAKEDTEQSRSTEQAFLNINGAKIPYKKKPTTPKAQSVVQNPSSNEAPAQTYSIKKSASSSNIPDDQYSLPFQPVKKAVPIAQPDTYRSNLIANGSLNDGGLASLFNLIKMEILTESPNVRFSDIIGLSAAKKILRESVILPRRYPHLFEGGNGQGSLAWKGLLVYGSPGSGKTCLAKALATESRSVFFCVSSATLTSKYHGESEKLVRCLFIMARQYESAVIFFDEVDSILSSRTADGEHEASRRMKSEMLQQIDGLSSYIDSSSRIFVLCATNFPWEIDQAMLRRLEKRIFIELPGFISRIVMIKKFLGSKLRYEDTDSVYDAEDFYCYDEYVKKVSEISHDKEDILSEQFFTETLNRLQQIGLKYLVTISVLTSCFSGADLHILCTEACMTKIREVLDVLEKDFAEDQITDVSFKESNPEVIDKYLNTVLPKDQDSLDSNELEHKEIRQECLEDQKLDLSVGYTELKKALMVTKPSFHPPDLQKYIDWGAAFGSG